MDLHPAVAKLHDSLAAAALQNPHPPGTPESEAYHTKLAEMAQPQEMHNHLGCGIEELMGKAQKAATASTINESHDQRLYDQKQRYGTGVMNRYG